MRVRLNNYRRERLLLMKVASFFTSMFPLSLFLLFKYGENKNLLFKFLPINLIAFSIFIIELLAIIYILYFFKRKVKRGNLNRERFNIKGIVQNKTNTSNYLLANVLPVITLEIERSYSFIFNIILIILLAFMYIKNDLYYINPLYDIINIKSYSASVYNDNSSNVVNADIRVIISIIPLYEFNGNIYEGIRFGEVLIVSKRIR